MCFFHLKITDLHQFSELLPGDFVLLVLMTLLLLVSIDVYFPKS